MYAMKHLLHQKLNKIYIKYTSILLKKKKIMYLNFFFIEYILTITHTKKTMFLDIHIHFVFTHIQTATYASKHMNMKCILKVW